MLCHTHLKAIKTSKMHCYGQLLISVLGLCKSRGLSKLGYPGGCRQGQKNTSPVIIKWTMREFLT